MCEWDEREEKRVVTLFARGLLTVLNKQNKNISEFVVPFALLFFVLSE